MNIVLVTAWGEEHGLINTIPNRVSYDGFKHMSAEHRKELELQKKEDEKLVEAEYMNSEGKGERLEVPYCKYQGDPIQIWKFIPGYVYKVPLGLINQVNDKTKIPKKREGLLSVQEKTVNRDGSPLRRDEDGEWVHKFVPVRF